MPDRRTPPPKCRQCAALPLSHQGGETRLLLVTSRETRRWVVPKGWLEKGVSAATQAAREAFEEAGIRGKISNRPLGRYTYPKRLPDGTALDCEVEVYALEIDRLLHSWPEEGQRERRWFTLPEAAEAVQEAGLAQLMLQLATRSAA